MHNKHNLTLFELSWVKKGLDDLDAGTVFRYPGLLIDEYQLQAVERELHISLSMAYAKGGIKGRGKRTLILGQFTPRTEPFLCAHLVNCVYGTTLKPNANWGDMRVDDIFFERYPKLAKGLSRKEIYPGIRLSKAVKVGSEVLLHTYGPGYWARHRREQAWEDSKETTKRLKKDKMLTPRS